MTPAEELAMGHVTRRVDDMDLVDAIDITAIETGLSPEHIKRVWKDLGINPVQERIINFLKCDHGLCTTASLLPHHPVARELELGPQDHVYVEFAHESFVVMSDGSFSPIGSW